MMHSLFKPQLTTTQTKILEKQSAFTETEFNQIFEKIENDVFIREYFLVCGYLYAENITNGIVCKALGITEIAGRKIIQILRQYKIIKTSPIPSQFSIEPHTQLCIRKKDKENAMSIKNIDPVTEHLQTVVKALWDLYLSYNSNPDNFTKINTLIPHVESLIEQLEIAPSGLSEKLSESKIQIYIILIDYYKEHNDDPDRVIEYTNKLISCNSSHFKTYSPMIAYYLYQAAMTCVKLDKTADAVVYFKLVDRFYQKFNIKNLPEIAYAYHQLTIIYQKQEKLAEAALWQQNEILYLNANLPVDYACIGQRWIWLANIQRDQGNFAEAKECSKIAWGNYRQIQTSYFKKGNYKTDLAYSYVCLAQYKLLKGQDPKSDFKKAILWQQDALEAYKKKFTSANPNIANACCNLGLALVSHDPPKAIFYFNAAFLELEKFLQKNPALEQKAFITGIRIELNVGLGNAHRILGKMDKACAAHKEAMKYIKELKEKNKYLALVAFEQAQDCVVLGQKQTALFNFNLAKHYYSELNPQHSYIEIIEDKLKLLSSDQKQIDTVSSIPCNQNPSLHSPAKVNGTTFYYDKECNPAKLSKKQKEDPVRLISCEFVCTT